MKESRRSTLAAETIQEFHECLRRVEKTDEEIARIKDAVLTDIKRCIELSPAEEIIVKLTLENTLEANHLSLPEIYLQTDITQETARITLSKLRKSLINTPYTIANQTRIGYQIVIEATDEETENLLSEIAPTINKRTAGYRLLKALVEQRIQNPLEGVSDDKLQEIGQAGSESMSDSSYRSAINILKSNLDRAWTIKSFKSGYILVKKHELEDKNFPKQELAFRYLLSKLRSTETDTAYQILLLLIERPEIDFNAAQQAIENLSSSDFAKAIFAIKKWLNKEQYSFEIQKAGKANNQNIKDYQLVPIQS